MGANIILYGPPGTGKTYNTVAYAISIIYGRPVREVMKDDYNELLEKYHALKTLYGQIEFTTFHQSFGYEEFIEGIKPTRFYDVQVRVRDDFNVEMHIDTDDANSAGLRNGDMVTIIKK